jgi:hypothetical protein
MSRIKGHILDRYSPFVAEGQSCHVAYLIANILTNSDKLKRITDASVYIDKTITNITYSKLNYMKKVNLADFAYLYESIKLFEGEVG